MIIWFLLTLALAAATACGGDDDTNGSSGSSDGGDGDSSGPGEHLDPGVDPQRELADLSTAETAALCDSAAKWAHASLSSSPEAIHATCMYTAGIGAGAAATDPDDVVPDCEAAVAQCKQDGFPERDPCAGQISRLMQCGARVQLWQDCFEDNLDASIERFKDLTCEQLPETSLQDITVTTPASCTELSEQCPNLGGSVPQPTPDSGMQDDADAGMDDADAGA